MNAIPHLAGRVFGTPLMVEPRYANVIADVLLDKQATGQARAWDGPSREKRPYEVVDGMAIVPVLGGLVARSYGLDAMSGLTDYGMIEDMLMEAATDPGVAGIMLDIDSPGGEAAGPFELADFIRQEVRALKPVWAVAQYQACSAAYAIGSAAEKLYVAPSGDIGSIGVVMLHRDQSEAETSAGLKYTYIFAGKGKVWGNPHEPLSAEAEAEFQAHVNDTYERFVALVSANRSSLSGARIRENGARIFNAQNAVRMGYADKIGVMRDALTDFSSALSSRRTGSALMAAPGKPEALASIKRHPAASLVTDEKEISMSDDKTPAGKDNAAEDIEPDATGPEAQANAERNRCAAIAKLCNEAGAAHLADGLIASGASIEDAKAKVQDVGALRDVCKRAAGSLDTTAEALVKEFTEKGVGAGEAATALLERMAARSDIYGITNALPAEATRNSGGDGTGKTLDPTAIWKRRNGRK